MPLALEPISVEALQELRQQQTDFILLDVREPAEYAVSHLDGLLIPLAELPNRLGELDKNKQIIVHCRSDGRSQRAAAFLLEAGFSYVAYLQGGISAWAKKIDPSLVVS